MNRRDLARIEQMWADALRITWSSPLTGVGVGEYGQAQYWLARPTSDLIGTPYAHNAVLQFAAEFGVIAGIAFAALCLWWLLGDWTRRRASPALVCVVAMVALLGIHAMLEWSLWVLFIAILAGLLFALGQPPLRRAFGLDVRPIFAALGVAGLAWAPLMKADYDTVADAAWNLEFEESIGYGISKEMIEGLTTNSTATYFKPQSDRFVIRAYSPSRTPQQPVNPIPVAPVQRLESSEVAAPGPPDQVGILIVMRRIRCPRCQCALLPCTLDINPL